MKLFYRRLGKGPTIIILHGLYGSSDNWYSIAKSLSNDFEIIIPDMRNHGKSPHSPYMNYEVMQNDIYELMNELNLKKAIILGHSMGGKTAMFFAKYHPERISHLLIADISPFPYIADEEVNTNFKIHKKIIHTVQNIHPDNFKTRNDIYREMIKSLKVREMVNFLLKNLKRDESNKFVWRLNIDAIDRSIIPLLGGLDPENIDEQITGFPVLFIKGSMSSYIKNADIEQIKQVFPAAEFVTIHKAGHWLHSEQPEKLTETIMNFINNS